MLPLHEIHSVTIKASDLFVQCLEREGVEYIFGLPGEENLDLLESLRTSSIRLIVTRHEQHAAFMAANYGRLTGKAGVCLSTLGPGATNLLTGIAQAQLGGMPLVAITGQKPLRHNRQGGFQLIDVVSTFRPLTKWNRSIASSSTIPSMVRYAFQAAESERPGAAHLELPEDVAREELDASPQNRTRLHRPIADDETIRRAAERIGRAKRPIVLFSGGANRKRIGDELARFVETTGIFAIATQMGKGVLPEDHPRSLFSLGINRKDYVHRAIEISDLVITLGYDIREYPPSVWNGDKSKPVVHVDFTPSEADEFYDPSYEVVGDVASSLRALGRVLENVGFDTAKHADLREEIAQRLHAKRCRWNFPPSPRNVVFAVRDVLDRTEIVCLDNGIYKLWFARLYPTYAANTLLLDNALATMGAGLATAMSAKLVHPDRRVLAVCGDGGFMMNSQDLETAVRLGLDLVVLVLRDGAYGFIRWKQQDMDFADFAMDFGNPDFVRYAECHGATGLRVSEGEGLREVLERAFEIEGVVLIDCPIDYTENAELNQHLSLTRD
jgi:acetolactate synthase-1/2/3 large subunit